MNDVFVLSKTSKAPPKPKDNQTPTQTPTQFPFPIGPAERRRIAAEAAERRRLQAIKRG